jgi:preprotein translocase subunit YajC
VDNFYKLSGVVASFFSGTFLAGPVFAQGEGASPSASQGFGMFLPLILIFVIFYFLIVRPQQKQAKQRQAMIKAIEKGDEVITVGGIHGRIVGVADTVLTVEISDNCKVKMDRSGIQSVREKKAS